MLIVTLTVSRTLVRSALGLRGKRVKWKRAEGVEGPSPGAVKGGNGRALMGPEGPYILLGLSAPD